ncbi:primosomal protein N' [Kiloniella laminariae]|uniref:Replication restart protein PriA n=1 Tax=Kiloniella laminariae TaxID=454162 RepID=A0ABT4LQ57_9PROT|nr:primosomal protein N' [Kiloniella laminariae]MCZ4282451.1 primosomal protein N' [Kiloniella laminariae]
MGIGDDLMLFEETVPERCRYRVQVILPVEGPYDYLAPDGGDEGERFLPLGQIVMVPVGKRILPGVIWGGEPDTSVPQAKLRQIEAITDLPPLKDELRQFIEWVASYTLFPRGSVLKMVLSAPQALESVAGQKLYRQGDTDTEDTSFRITPARQKVLDLLAGSGGWTAVELAREAGVSGSVIKGLEQAGVVEGYLEVPDFSFPLPPSGIKGPVLSEDQRAAADDLINKVRAGNFAAVVLDGVTGSGKTEVYFEAIEAALGEGQQILVLLPEIALSSQWLDRFEQRFGVRPAEWHSELTPALRRKTWRAVSEGKAPVVVGARSSLFLPYEKLGLIIVDEEHEASFKQEEGVCYHARDMAVVRARGCHCPVVLASATPALETMINVQNGRYERLVLSGRHGGAGMPDVELVDLRFDKPERLDSGQGWLSQALRGAIRQTLEAGEQAMLFLNRRGYAPLTLCRTCGHRLQCPHCTAWLVEHRRFSRLQCHHCGYSTRLPDSCPSCDAEGSLVPCGPGVERIVEEAKKLFPEARIGLMASDTMTSPAATREMIERIEKREVNLLVGTQVVAKGYHFPYLTLVGVVDADLGLFGGDLRAAERTFQLLHQVAGRAGRAEHKGRVILQTSDPQHPVMQTLKAGDRDKFLEIEAETRSRGGLPPFGRLAAVIVSGPEEAELDNFCATMARAIPTIDGARILGPAPAPLSLLRGKFRRRFLVMTRRSVAPQAVARSWLQGLKSPSRVRVVVDIDPYSFL